MTQEEADKIARVIGTADGGCDTCVGDLVELLNGADLGFQWAATGKVAKYPVHEEDEYYQTMIVVTATPAAN